MNTPPNISHREWAAHLEAPEISARDCEESCEHGRDATTWLSTEDKNYCDDCIGEYYQNEIEQILARTAEGLFFSPHCDEYDDFLYVNVLNERGHLCTIHRRELEEVRRNNKGAK